LEIRTKWEIGEKATRRVIDPMLPRQLIDINAFSAVVGLEMSESVVQVLSHNLTAAADAGLVGNDR